MKKFFSVFCIALMLSFSVKAVSITEGLKPQQLRVYGLSSPVTAYVFTSFSCPHCTVFHNEVLPELKKLVETKRLQIVLVEMPYDARAMTGTLLARCLPSQDYEKFSKAMFDNQSTWSYAQNPKPIITGYAKLLGMSDEKINACLADKKLAQTITHQRNNLSDLYGVTGMPSVAIVSGGEHKLLTGTDKEVILETVKKKMAY